MRKIGNERGQAMVEFAIAAPVFVLLVAGIIQFGVAINYWFDLNRIANQGARWAVVNAYPGCPRTGPDTTCTPSLQQYLSCEPAPSALKPNVTISFPAGATADNVGDPVKVKVSSPWKFVPIIGIGTLNLTAEATMRIEQNRGRYVAGSGSCP